MRTHNIVYCKATFSFGKNQYGQLDCRLPCIVPSLNPDGSSVRVRLMREKKPYINYSNLNVLQITHKFLSRQVKGLTYENQGELSDEDDDLCPVDCVKEFKTDEELFKTLEKAKKTDSLVVVDFYRTSCGSCKYIAQGFSKLCRGSGDQDAAVIFLKHNVIDEYDDQSEVAERLRIKSVPLFHFYKDGVLLESFATRDKERIDAAILKYTSPATKSA